MAYTLGDLLRDVYTELGQLAASVATGGSTSTLVDATQAGKHGDGAWVGGALLMIEAGGEAPEGEYQRISGYMDSSGSFSVETDFSAAVESGDSYGLVSAYYPLHTMVELCNAALRGLGDLALVETVELEGEGSERSVPVTWKRRRPLLVEVQREAGDESEWERVYDWEYVPAAPGESGALSFHTPPPAGRLVRAWYVDAHPRLREHDDVVAETIAPELAAMAGVERALRWQNARLAGGDPYLLQRWGEAKAELGSVRLQFPVWSPRRVARLLSLRER